MILAMVLLGGCADPTWRDASSTSISSRGSWRVWGDFRDPAAVTDGNLNTVASTSDNYRSATLTTDLGKSCVFNMIILDQGPGHEENYCRRFSVLISDDNLNYRTIYTGVGTRRVTYVKVLTPTLARYVRLEANVPGDRPWRIAEMYLQ